MILFLVCMLHLLKKRPPLGQMAFHGRDWSCLSLEQVMLPEEEKAERVMRSLECAVQEKADISLR